jgi:hypothetical protein
MLAIARKPGMVRTELGYLTAQMSRTVGFLVAATAALAAAVPASAAGSVFTPVVAKPSRLSAGGAAAGTHYGGSGYHGKRSANPAIGLLVRPDGRVSARASTGFACRRHSYQPVYIRLSGHAQGTAISASGHTRLPGTGTMRVTLQGTADGQTASGSVRIRVRGCRGWTNPFVLHTESAPAGAPAMPPPSSVFTGLTVQTAGGIRMPVSVSVTHTGKVWAMWDASMKCHRGNIPMTNVTPLTKIRPDGTFSRSEHFNIRYTDGFTYHYNVKLSGAFRADGVSGTLRASVRFTKRGGRYYPCHSGTQAWAARG